MSKNKVLVIGSGGREHAITYFLSQSPHVEKVFCAPGNAGMAQHAELVSINPDQHAAVHQFISQNNISLTVIGPEAPLVGGLSDALRAQGHLVVGASQAAAQLEGSKIFAKKFMVKYNIPTADFREFNDPQAAKAFAASPEGKTFQVLKADGLAAGKGVFVCNSESEVVAAIETVMEEKKFGAAGSKIILEEKLVGPEVSVMALIDGKTILPFPASQDHKRQLEGDQGPNTGGMGAYTPTPFYDEPVRAHAQTHIIDNFIRGIQAEQLDFRGIIYFGLLLTSNGPQVLEFNVRLGDPEAQVILPMVESDLFDAFKATAEGNLSSARLTARRGAACTVVLTSGGYPAAYEKGHPIRGIDDAQNDQGIFVFHAGTQNKDGDIVTSGGRVLNVTALGDNLEAAVVHAYEGLKKISFKNAFFRRDIAARAIEDQSIYEKIKKMKWAHDSKLSINA